ncbi:MAG: ATP-binding cassette domain-containing protein [Firmicutes bacterium]|nr:ATP-binding cassette domain-containing protein [Bacillota bacterium]
MIQAINVSLQYGKRILFSDVNLKFTAGNCYGVIGANGSGKSTFLKVLSGEITPNKGEVAIGKNERLSVLAQNQNAFDDFTVINAVVGGHEILSKIAEKKEKYYALENMTEKQGIELAELEMQFAELGGWEAESEAENLLAGIGVGKEYFYESVADLDAKLKVKVLLARALFGNPDVLILDEPTNNLDIQSVRWLEEFLLNFQNTVIIVSHNRHFLNKVCTHICDVDYSKINMFVGNYDFWYQTSQLILRQMKESNKKAEQRADELKDFIARFSANASKSKQATSRKKELERLTIEDIKPSSRKYPYINFDITTEMGNDCLVVENLTLQGFFSNVSFRINRADKVAFLSPKSLIITKLFDCLMGKIKADSGTITFGKTVVASYMPQDNREFFDGVKLNLVDWLKQYSKEQNETFIRSWLGRMLFSGEESQKAANVLSGGEKVRCMLAKTMLVGGNFLVLDEPTNHLDLESIESLNEGMKKFKGCMLFTTHDEEILNTVANRIIEINETKVIDKLCSFSEYTPTLK